MPYFDPDAFIAENQQQPQQGFNPDQFIMGAQAAPEQAPQMQGLNIPIEEMHPDVSTLHRLVVKNFSNSPQASVQYLQERYPNLEFKLNDSGRVLIKRPDEKQYKVLDPSKGLASDLAPTSLEYIKDLGDIAYDTAAGIGSGAATAGGALLGGATTLPALGTGALPGAAVAGGATSSALEGLKQKIGQWVSIPQDIDTSQIKTAGVLGAATPFVFGANKAPGLVQKGYSAVKETVLPKVGQAVSGVPASAIKTLGKNYDEIKQLEQSGIGNIIEDTFSTVKDGLDSVKLGVGKEIETAINSTGQTVNLATVRKPLKDLIAETKLISKELKTPQAKEEFKTITDEFKNLFLSDNKQVLDEVSAPAAFKLQQQLKDLSDLGKLKAGNLTSRFGDQASVIEKKLKNAAKDSYSALNNELSKAVNKVDLPGLKQQYKDVLTVQKELTPYFKTPQKTYQTLSNLGAKNKQLVFEKLKDVQKKYNVDVFDQAKKLEAFSYFGKNPALDSISSGATTSTSRSVPLAIAGSGLGGYAGYSLGGWPGSMLGAGAGGWLGSKLGSPQAIKLYTGAAQHLDAPINATLNEMANPMLMQPTWKLMQNYRGE